MALWSKSHLDHFHWTSKTAIYKLSLHTFWCIRVGLLGMTGRFFDQDRIKNDQNSDKNKGCFLSSKSLRPFYRATHLVSPSRIGQTGEYSKFKFTKPRSATRWATLYIKKCVLSPAGGSHLLNFVRYLYLTSICRFFLIKYDIEPFQLLNVIEDHID